MTDPKAEPSHEMKKADAVNGEPEALDESNGGKEHRTGEAQARENQETEPPA
jgi:hypothetical protein